MRVELHCHSTHSDGSELAAAVARRAELRNVELFCLTDHDTCAGYEATREVLGDDRVIRGVEVSCIEYGRTVHMLFYEPPDCDWTDVAAMLVEQHKARRKRVHAIAARLEQLGVHLDADALLLERGDRSVGRPHIAQALVDSGAVMNMREAFNKYLHDGGPADVPVQQLTVEQALVIGRRAGARMSLAHPHILGKDARRLVRRYRNEGLDGLEVYYGQYTAGERKDWLRFADSAELVATGGSDFHGTVLPAVADVGVDIPDDRARLLVGWLGR